MSWSVALNCVYGVENYTSVGNIYRCKATLLSDAGNDTVTLVYGNHQAGRNHNDVQGLHIENQNMAFFPRNVSAFFPNIKVFYFPKNSISTISRDHLIPHPNLVRLSVSSNKITSLDRDLLFDMPYLQYVHFGTNNLKHVEHDFVLPYSGVVYFDNNPCIDTYATTPAGILTLKFLLLVKCPPTISQIEKTLESRPNFIKTIISQVQMLTETTHSLEESHRELKTELQENKILIQNLSDEILDLKNNNLQLETRVAFLEAAIGNILGIKTKKL